MRPVLAPQLSEFCIQLTTIIQQDVDVAAPFPEVLAAFHRWAEQFAPYKLASWGEYDRRQIASDCELHKIVNPFASSLHVNVKGLFAEAYQLRRQEGLGQAIRRLGLTRKGIAHRGIDDARNIVRILQAGLGTLL